MGPIKKSIWVSVLALIASLTFQPIVAQAADNCVPDKIEFTKFAIHPGQTLGLVLNGQALAAPCTTADPGIVGLTYGDRGNVVLESGSLTDINSWKWKDFTYEDLILMFKTAGIKQAIDAQKVLSFYFYRNVKGTIDLANPIASLGIILDPTTAGPCHPDLVSFKDETVSLTNSIIQILDGAETGIQCTIPDPGWIAFGYLPPGSTTIQLYQVYFDRWMWGGEIDYKWVQTMLGYANIDTSKIEKGSKFQLRYYRGGNPKTAPVDLAAVSFSFAFNIDLPTPAQIAEAKAAADKKIADEKAAADKVIADKAAADKAVADKAAADKALADKAAADKAIADKAAAAAKAAAAKKITITCVKGKLTKKVTAVKPVCPSGYKKK
jgi:hypothetical protein